MPKKGNTKNHKTVDCNSWGSMEEEEKPKSLPLYRNLYLLKLLDRNNPKFPLNNRHWSKTLRFNRQPSKISYYKCSANCIPCTGYSFCSHTVAIAESEGNFETIIKWYEANKQRPATSQPFGRLICQQGWAKNAKIHPGTQRGNQQK